MSNVEGPTSIVLPHGPPNDNDFRRETRNGGESVDYLRGRERAEQLAASRAQTGHARRVHQELADHYARQIQLLNA
jgi:hypothetical protein